LVCIWFFTGVFMFCRFMCESGEPISNPPRLRSFFSIASGHAVENPLAVRICGAEQPG